MVGGSAFLSAGRPRTFLWGLAFEILRADLAVTEELRHHEEIENQG